MKPSTQMLWPCGTVSVNTSGTGVGRGSHALVSDCQPICRDPHSFGVRPCSFRPYCTNLVPYLECSLPPPTGGALLPACPLHHFQFICLCPHRVPSSHACRSPSKDIYLGSALSEGSAVARVRPLAAKGSHSHCSKDGCDSRMAISACLPWDKAVCQEGLLNNCVTEDGNKRVCAQVSPGQESQLLFSSPAGSQTHSTPWK